MILVLPKIALRVQELHALRSEKMCRGHATAEGGSRGCLFAECGEQALATFMARRLLSDAGRGWWMMRFGLLEAALSSRVFAKAFNVIDRPAQAAMVALVSLLAETMLRAWMKLRGYLRRDSLCDKEPRPVRHAVALKAPAAERPDRTCGRRDEMSRNQGASMSAS
jgi:hypothetical protein